MENAARETPHDGTLKALLLEAVDCILDRLAVTAATLISFVVGIGEI